MFLERRLWLAICACFLAVASSCGQTAQRSGEPAEAVYSERSLGLSFSYPAAMTPSVTAPPESDRCLHLLFSVNTPADASTRGRASLSFFELDRSCVPKAEWENHDRLLASMTKALYAQPGAQPIGNPLVYDYGSELSKQRMHMAAVKREQIHLLQMNFATLVHDRAVLWVIQASELSDLNQLAKMPVSFDEKPSVPLLPASIQPSGSFPKDTVKP